MCLHLHCVRVWHSENYIVPFITEVCSIFECGIIILIRQSFWYWVSWFWKLSTQEKHNNLPMLLMAAKMSFFHKIVFYWLKYYFPTFKFKEFSLTKCLARYANLTIKNYLLPKVLDNQFFSSSKTKGSCLEALLLLSTLLGIQRISEFSNEVVCLAPIDSQSSQILIT